MKRLRIPFIICVIIILAGVAGCRNRTADTSAHPVIATELTAFSEETTSAAIAETTAEPALEVPDMVAEADRGHHYAMDIVLDVGNRTVCGVVKVEVVNDSSEAWDTLCFRDYPSVFASGEYMEAVGLDASELKAKETKIDYFRNENGDELAFHRDGNEPTAVFVDLDRPLQPGEKRSVEYSYTATVPMLCDRYGTDGSVFNLCHFYLILAAYEDNAGWSTSPYTFYGESFYSICSDYSVRVHVPEEYTVISTGVLAETQEEDGGKVCVINALCARDFAMVAGPDFQVLTEEVNGITVNSYYIGEERVFGEQMLISGIDALKAFGEAYGKYPYPEVDIVETSLMAGGMEYSGLVMISSYTQTYTGGTTDDENYVMVRDITAHELAHQWFYGLIGTDPYSAPWLDESFAAFSEFVYFEESGDDLLLYNLLTTARNQGFLDPVNLPFKDYDDIENYYYTIYRVGSIMLYDLRNAMGEDVFYDMMRTYVSRHAFENVNSDDFIDAVYEFAGSDNEEVNEVLEQYMDLEPAE